MSAATDMGSAALLGLANANLPDEMVMRVGIPHRSGRLAFHAFQEGYKVMVSASAFWDAKTATFKIPEYTDLWELDVALDSAGFSSMRLWREKGRQTGIAGVYPWTYSQYIELAACTSRSWWSQPDCPLRARSRRQQGRVGVPSERHGNAAGRYVARDLRLAQPDGKRRLER